MGLRFRVVLVTGLVVCGGLIVGVASAQRRPQASVWPALVGHNGCKGRVGSSKTSCTRGRVVRLQARQGHKWVSVTTVKSNHSGRFQGTLRHRGGGPYRAVAPAKRGCAAG